MKISTSINRRAKRDGRNPSTGAIVIPIIPVVIGD